MPRAEGLRRQDDGVLVWAVVRRPKTTVETTRTVGLAVCGCAPALWLGNAWRWVVLVALFAAALWWLRFRDRHAGPLLADEHGVSIAGHRFPYARLRIGIAELEHHLLLRIQRDDVDLRWRVTEGHTPSVRTWVDYVNQRALQAEAAYVDTDALDRLRAPPPTDTH